MAKNEKTQEIEVRSIRVKRASIACEWTQGDDDYKVTFHDNPLPSLYKALDGLKPHVVSLAELPAKDEEKLSVTGITVSTKGEAVQATITAKKPLKRNKRVLNIATPILPMYENEENKEADHMSDDEAAAVEKLIKEAKKYIAGDRAQGKLALEDGESEKGKKDKGPDNVAEFPALTEPAANDS